MILQTFECTVCKIGKYINLIAKDLTNENLPKEIWRVSSIKFPKDIQLGHVYILTIERINNKLFSKFEPLKLPKLTEDELEEINKEAKALEELFK